MSLRALTLLLLLCLPLANADATPPSIASVTVQGVLQSGEVFVAPGFGESPSTDKADTAYYLQLPASLATQLHPASTMAEFTAESQGSWFVYLVVFDEEKSVVRSLVGKRVRVVGTLVEADAPHRRTAAVIQVKSVAGIRDWQW
jgi:hypothetical protein